MNSYRIKEATDVRGRVDRDDNFISNNLGANDQEYPL